jgi:signal transduction histidine kinase
VLVGTWIVLACLHLALPPQGRLRTWPLAYMLLEILAAASLAYRARKTVGEERLAWWLLATSALLEVPNLLVTSLVISNLAPAWSTGLPSILSLATGVLVLTGVLSFPKGQERGGMFRRRALDSLLFATSVLFLLWVMGVQGSLRTAAAGVGFRVFVAYLNVALLGGGLVFMTSYHPDRAKGPLGWLAASALAWLAGFAAWTLAGLPSVVASEWWIVLAGGIPLFQGLAAWSPRPVEEALAGADPERRGAGLLPYLPASFAIAALAMLLIWAPLNVTRAALAIFLGMVVLLLVRQFQAIQDLQAARRTLEDRVHQRTEALEQAQDTLLRTERMNTLALMGAGLAHDLNNLLSAMKSSAELAAMTIEEGSAPAQGDLLRIATAADRAALLTRRLMGFVRRESEELSPTDLGLEVKEMEVTLRLLLPHTVDLHIEVSPELLIVRSSRLRLEQMLVNLVANARDAMPEGGNLRIQVGPEASSLDQAMIEVADSGSGMTREVLDRIFEPFFTTKPAGKGTGLGLPSLKAMVEEGGGSLEVASEPGQGSQFRIRLPRLPAEGLSPR